MSESFMSNQPPPEPPQMRVKVPEHLASGQYATAMVVTHGKEEFVVDFIASFAPPPRLAGRVILSPPHAKRLATALRENIALYEKHHGTLPAPPTPQAAQTVKAGNFYAQLAITDALLGGAYSNNVMIRHGREEFVLDFLATFQPSAVLVARVLVSPPHISRIANALDARLRLYEDAFGKIGEPPTGESPKSSGTEPSEPPDSPEGGPRFKIV